MFAGDEFAGDDCTSGIFDDDDAAEERRLDAWADPCNECGAAEGKPCRDNCPSLT